MNWFTRNFKKTNMKHWIAWPGFLLVCALASQQMVGVYAIGLWSVIMVLALSNKNPNR